MTVREAPSSDSAWIFPLCTSVTAFAIASPRPKPPDSELRELSARANRSNSRSAFPFSMGSVLFLTVSLAFLLNLSSEISTVPPSGEYFMALSSRTDTSLATAFSSPLILSPGSTEEWNCFPCERASDWNERAVSSASSEMENSCVRIPLFSSSILER